MSGTPSLFDVPSGPMVRPSDPETARMAADAQTPARLSRGRRAVLMALYRYEALSDFDYQGINGMIQTSAGKRRHELMLAGLVEEAPMRGLSPSGSQVQCYRLTHEGRCLAVRLEMEQALDG
jgi:hypothetical protein